MEVVIMSGRDLPNGTYLVLALVLCVIAHEPYDPPRIPLAVQGR